MSNLLDITLSRILATTPKFTSFDELIPPTSQSLLLHEVFVLNKIIDDVHKYLQQVNAVLSSIVPQEELNWYYEGRDQVASIVDNIDSLERTISRLLNIIDGTTDFKISTSLTLSKFEDTSNVLMDIKKYVIIYKKKVEVAKNYKEIKENIMKSLSHEIDNCLELASKLLATKLSASKLNLDAITAKIFNDLVHCHSLKSIRLPTINGSDELIYNEYLSLEERINPLGISLDILPLKIEEFDAMCGGKLFPRERFDVLTAYDKLSQAWNSLRNIMKVLKRECVDAQWNEIFKNLISETILKCNTLTKSLENANSYVTDDIGSMYKLCSNTISIIGNAFKENLITDIKLVSMFNDNLSTKWQVANDMMTRFTEMQAFHSRLGSPELGTSMGLDLGVDVNTSNVPYSIQKKDKVQDFFNPSNPALKTRRRGLRFSLQSFNDLDTMVEDDDASTLVTHKTPKIGGGGGQERFLVPLFPISHNDFDASTFLNKLATTVPLKPSNIPIIQPDYFKRGLPITKKKYLDYKASRLPSISPNHPVFNSPDRKRESKQSFFFNNNELLLTGKLGSPIRQNHKRILSLSEEASNKRPTSLLRDMKVPNLSHKNSIQAFYNSTSPERPTSSLGSRFDAAHLLQSQW